MNTILARRIKRKLQRELIKRKLIEYFTSKGYDNFNKPLYPPSCYDLPIKVPQLYTRCEIIPTIEETDTVIGTVKLNWKCFVLGVNRMDLGLTTHTGQTDVIRAVMGGPDSNYIADYKTTPKELIEFILKILDNSKAGYVELPHNFILPHNAMNLPLLRGTRSPRLSPSPSGAFYNRFR